VLWKSAVQVMAPRSKHSLPATSLE